MALIDVSLAAPCGGRNGGGPSRGVRDGGLGGGLGLLAAEELVVRGGLGPEADEVTVRVLPLPAVGPDVGLVEVHVVAVPAHCPERSEGQAEQDKDRGGDEDDVERHAELCEELGLARGRVESLDGPVAVVDGRGASGLGDVVEQAEAALFVDHELFAELDVGMVNMPHVRKVSAGLLARDGARDEVVGEWEV